MSKPSPFVLERLNPWKQGFVLLDALSGVVSERILTPMLKRAGIVPPSGSWGLPQIIAVRRSCEGLYIRSGTMMHPALRHSLSELAARDAVIVDAVQGGWERFQGLPACSAGLQYLAAYTADDALFRAQAHNEHVALYRRPLLLDTDFSHNWLMARPQHIRNVIFGDMVSILFEENTLHSSLKESLQSWKDGEFTSLGTAHLPLLPLLHFFWNDEEKARQLLACDAASPLTLCMQGFMALVLGRGDDALSTLLEARKALRRVQGKRNLSLGGLFGVALQMSRLLSEDKAILQIMRSECLSMPTYANEGSEPAILGFRAVLAFDQLRQGNVPEATQYLESARGMRGDIFSTIIFRCACARTDPGNAQWVEDIQKGYANLQGLLPLASLWFTDALGYIGQYTKGKPYTRAPEADAYVNWVSLIRHTERWEGQLENLSQWLGVQEGPVETKERRLIWVVEMTFGTVQPFEQSRQRNGQWTKGKPAGLRRLCEQEESKDWLREQDRLVLRAIHRDNSWRGSDYCLDHERALAYLVGHPLLLHGPQREPLTLEAGQLELVLRETGQGCSLSLPRIQCVCGNSALLKKAENHYILCPFPLEVRKVAAMLGKTGLDFPPEAMPRLLEMARSASTLAVRTEVSAQEVEGNPAPVVQLRQWRTSFEALLRVRPLDVPHSPVYAPGRGVAAPVISCPSTEACALAGRTVRVLRDFAAEHKAMLSLQAACPTLREYCDEETWESNDLENVLNLLSELQECPVPHSVEWPEGEELLLRGELSSKQVRLSVQQAGDWFALEGKIHIQDDYVLDMCDFLEKMQESKGRFVALDNGQYVAMTEALKRKLHRLRLLSAKGKQGKVRNVHPLAAESLDDAIQGMDVASDQNWLSLLSRMRTAQSALPQVPLSLQANLRDYQREGFVWLSRLSAWGVGACLADDMGLGKTVQAIAVMLEQASKGPCLVVAPTSVCTNWEQELSRFAPSLEVLRLGDAGKRKELVSTLSPGKILIVGYGLLHKEQATLAAIGWQMVIFDEAQALKNAATQRAKAARTLRSSFTLALTGTPIENHIDDLWSLFNIINPGLLGTQKSFQARFGGQADSQALRTLKALVRPFLLRRLKSDVLEELPSRTEQTLRIEPSARERIFYEALRRRAVDAVENMPESGGGQRRFHILAELTRLRRACCHASLAEGEAKGEVEDISSKMASFLELVEDLRAGGHKVLAFSQFVGHLSMVREALVQRSIPFQYLDGSTPEKERARSVADFQAGKGDVFLISLRAGGQGLNLTAADYVVHLDPWWNPAVEDQASDRAHRIGQLRPVTIYRLVMADSVEEKILTLHQRKRELAADFLEGANTATDLQLSEEELLGLFQ